MIILVNIIFFILLKHAYCVDVGNRCITPNGELATCVPLTSCDILLKGVLDLDDAAIEFARNSQCHTETLVCCGSYGVLMTLVRNSDLIEKSSVCGYEQENDRIYGGMITDLTEFPWMALLGYRSDSKEDIEFKCGGTLINDRYVLTAAHCIRTNPTGIILEIVRLGEWKISTDNDCEIDSMMSDCAEPVVDLQIEKKIAHPNYSMRTGSNNIGLLKLERSVVFTDYIKPICLPPFNALELNSGSRSFISGWGATEKGISSDYKLKLEVPIIANNQCQTIFGKRVNITENQICAGGEEGRDACQGDSGGPLMVAYVIANSNVHQWHQEGIISSGIGCARKGYPAIYTRVSSYLKWISEKVLEI